MSLSVRATRALESTGVELQSVRCVAATATSDGTCLSTPFRAGEFCAAGWEQGSDAFALCPSTLAAPFNFKACPDGRIDLQYRTRNPVGTETAGDADGTPYVLVGYNCIRPIDMVGQIRSNNFVPGVAAMPKWSGNVTATYKLGDLTAALNAKYVGGAKMNNEWCDSAQDCANYQNSQGSYLLGSIDNNVVKPYVNFSLNGSYDLHVGELKQFQVFGSISNLFDKTPPFTGGGISGATANYHDVLGRAYRMGVRLSF
jgi:hypothetical protein